MTATTVGVVYKFQKRRVILAEINLMNRYNTKSHHTKK